MNTPHIYPGATVGQNDLEDPPRKWDVYVGGRWRRAYDDRDTAVRKARELWALEIILGAGFEWVFDDGQQLLARPREDGGPLREPYIYTGRILNGVCYFYISGHLPPIHDPVEALVRFAGLLIALGEA